jgi:hypothetical protein
MMAPSMTVTAPTTDRMTTSRILLAVALSGRTAQPSHRGYTPASHMVSCKHYDRYSGALPAGLQASRQGMVHKRL